ncbi:MAG: ABC transporter permease [Xanthobacteraceae bacterium]|nr:ABC transporter permease [Xanthobacteraceae bacterium]
MKRTASRAHLIQFGFVLLVAVAWYLSTATGSVSRLFLPAPEAVWLAFSRLVVTRQFWSAVEVTLVTVAQAYAIAVVAGLLAGYAISRSRFRIDVLEPIIAGLFTIPITLFFPIFILFFGIGTASKVAYGATYAFFPIVLNTIASLANVEPHFLRAAKSMGASSWDTFRHVLIPSALPSLLGGMRIGFFICFAAVLGGETLSSVAGVGRNIALAAELMEPARMYAWITFVVVTALTLNLVLSGFDRRSSMQDSGAWQ